MEIFFEISEAHILFINIIINLKQFRIQVIVIKIHLKSRKKTEK